MSGGSFDYLYSKRGAELLEHESDINHMYEELAKLGYAQDAARETLELLQTIRQFRVYTDTVAERLSPVWRAVEWWHSGDSGEEDVKYALENEYRAAFKK